MSYLVEQKRRRAAGIAVLTLFLVIACADLLFLARLRLKVMPPGGSFLTELARSAHSELALAALGCWALAAVLISFAIERALQPTSWVPLGVLLMRLQAASLTLMAVSPPGLIGDGTSMSGTLHQIGYYASMFFGAACPLVLAPAFRCDAEWEALTWPGRFTSLLAVGIVVGLMLWPPGKAMGWELAAVAILLVWLLLCAAGVMRSVHWFALPWERVRKRM